MKKNINYVIAHPKYEYHLFSDASLYRELRIEFEKPAIRRIDSPKCLALLFGRCVIGVIDVLLDCIIMLMCS